MRNHKIFITKFNIRMVFNVFTKFLDLEKTWSYMACTCTSKWWLPMVKVVKQKQLTQFLTFKFGNLCSRSWSAGRLTSNLEMSKDTTFGQRFPRTTENIWQHDLINSPTQTKHRWQKYRICTCVFYMRTTRANGHALSHPGVLMVQIYRKSVKFSVFKYFRMACQY